MFQPLVTCFRVSGRASGAGGEQDTGAGSALAFTAGEWGGGGGAFKFHKIKILNTV